MPVHSADLLVIYFKGNSWCLDGEGNGNPLQYSCLENPMDGFYDPMDYIVHGILQARMLE